ncbi:ABC-F family ATP-binding cassette domain-containing protein [Candidatus Dependentiae bacterium]|nr:ABC-F family ATP-binding cassette domain-containing protein [Candidatus Dependentiae bacterium]
MIQIRNLELQFGEQLVFDSVSCLINSKDRIGIVGRNGTGKSTFLKMIARHMRPDSGSIDIQKHFKIAYMPQEMVLTSTKNVLDETLSVFESLYNLSKEKEHLEFVFQKGNQSPVDVNRYAEIELELIEQNFNEKKATAQKLLSGLGFDERKQSLLVQELSVGWRMRVVLAMLLLQNADFYLFDEPTNHLDLSTKEWFLDFLKNSSFGYLLVCHDRYFLDRACLQTYEFALGKLHMYQGNYSYYVTQKEIIMNAQEQAYEKQQREIAQKERTIERFKAKSSKAKMAQSMMKALDKIERITLDGVQKTISLRFPIPEKSGQVVIRVQNVAHSFDQQIFRNVEFEIERNDKVAIIAPNGTGKTTLFNLIAKKLALQSGTIELGYNTKFALFDQDQDKVLHPQKTILQEVADCCDVPEQQIRSILGALLFGKDDISKKCSVLSGGERNRVAMSKVVLSGANVLLLDEPTNHLDIETKEIILKALQQFQGTIIFVSHDQDFVNQLASKIIELNQHGAFLYLGNYDSYLHMKRYAQNEVLQKSKQNEQIIIHSSTQELDSLTKQIKNVERKINKLESSLQAVVKSLETAEYGSARFAHLEKEYAQLQVMIQQETGNWENLIKQHEIKKS